MHSTKPDRETTAAYAASQPLFDVLRAAEQKVEEQRIHLTKARDLVQNVHVKLVDTTNIADCVMSAWAGATEAYTAIFDELRSSTAADPSEGKAAQKQHEHFRSMASSAYAAKKQATCYRDAKANGPTGANAEAAKSTTNGKRARKEDDQDGKDETGADSAHARRSKRSRKHLRQRERVLDHRLRNAGNAARQGPDGVNSDASDVDGGVKVKIEPSATVPGDVPPNGDLDPELVSAGKENSLPGVEYEDVSAEVDARLKAKEERKKARKEEKKRKRDSGDSAVVEAAVPERPSKKKSKIAEENGEMGGVMSEKPMKRRQGDGGGQEAGGGPKKRVKSKA